MALALLAALAGCASPPTSNPAEARLEREDFVAVARTLRALVPAVDGEVAAARAAWPFVLDGLPAHVGALARARILAAVRSAERLPLPALFTEQQAATLTGPGSPLAGRYRDFQQLNSASWRQIAVALAQIERGPARVASFARANAPIYIEGVYDAHYSIAETGRDVARGYETLGGAAMLGAVLGEREVRELEGSYTRAGDRLTPHERVKLGS